MGFRFAVVGGWIAALAVVLFADLSPWFAVPVTVLAGALVGRWWVLLVPVVPAVVLGLYALIDGRDPGDWWDAEPIVVALALAFAAAIFAFLLAVGVSLRKLRS